jgi:hypothetical protein
MEMGDYKYLIQQNWDIVNQRCASVRAEKYGESKIKSGSWMV